MASKGLTQRLGKGCGLLGRALVILLVRLCTLFYHHPLRHYTVGPIQAIIRSRHDPAILKEAVEKFRKGKEAESKLVGLASTLAAAAVIGVFSWPDIATTHWFCKALFYSSLLLAFFSLIGSAQQRLIDTTTCLEDIATPQHTREEAMRVFRARQDYAHLDDRHLMTWYTCNMCFVWQWTLMLMVWSWMGLLTALLLHIIKPFLPDHKEADAEKNIAIWFLAVVAFVLPSYVWCTSWTGRVASKSESTKALGLSVRQLLKEAFS